MPERTPLSGRSFVGYRWNCERGQSVGLRFGKSRNVLHENISALMKRLELALVLLLACLSAQTQSS